jgi:flagellar biosynthesis anti-sigma factor FlgM
MRIHAIRELLSPEMKKAEGTKKAEPVKKTSAADRTELSSNAQRLSTTKAEIDIVATQISHQPEIRQDKVAEAKQKIQDGYYNTPEFMDKLADKMALDFGAKKN